MIDDVDASLNAFLTASLGSRASIRFEPPTTAWSGALKGNAVDLFLYDVTEETDRRSGDWEDRRGEDGRLLGRQPPVRYYRLSYLVSAWAKDVAEEHALLADVMRACLDGEMLPTAFCLGALAEEETRVLLRLGLVATRTTAAHDLWSALGQPARSSLDLAVVAPLRPALFTDLAAPAEQISLNMNAEPKPAAPAEAPGQAAPARGGRRAATTPAPATVAPTEKKWTAFRIRERENVPPAH